MPFCSKCGTEVPENIKFCHKCGNTLQGGQNTSSGNVQARQSGNLSLWDYYIKVLKNYACFQGRARRKEYWGFTLFNFIIALGLAFAGAFLGGILGDEEGTLGVALYWLYCFGVTLPGFGTFIRRLHDVGKSGWNWLWCLTIVGIVPVFIWLCSDGQAFENEYGPDPKG